MKLVFLRHVTNHSCTSEMARKLEWDFGSGINTMNIFAYVRHAANILYGEDDGMMTGEYEMGRLIVVHLNYLFCFPRGTGDRRDS